MGKIITGEVVVPGRAEGTALVADEPISFWGGYNFHSGEITDRRHGLSGEIAAGKVLAVPFTRGSSTTTAVLLEALRNGTAPAAIITTGVDTFFALACIVARVMYNATIPVISVSRDSFSTLENGVHLSINELGEINIH
jgi:hypothetical protein